MTGVKMGDRFAAGRLRARRTAGRGRRKVGLSGRAVVVAPDEASAARARKAAEDAGVLVEVEVAPPTRLPLDRRRVRSRGGRRHRRPVRHDARRKIASPPIRELVRVLRAGRPRPRRRRRAARRPRRGAVAHAERTAVRRVGRRDQGARGRRVQVGAHAGRARGARVCGGNQTSRQPVTRLSRPEYSAAFPAYREVSEQNDREHIGRSFAPQTAAVHAFPDLRTTCIRRPRWRRRLALPKPTSWRGLDRAAGWSPHAEAVDIGRMLVRGGATVAARPAARASLFTLFSSGPAARRASGLPLALSSTLHAGLIAFAVFLTTFNLSPRAASLRPDDRPAGRCGCLSCRRLDQEAAVAAAACFRQRRHAKPCVKGTPESAVRCPSGASRNHCGRFRAARTGPDTGPQAEPLPAVVAPIVVAPADTRTRAGVLEASAARRQPRFRQRRRRWQRNRHGAGCRRRQRHRSGLGWRHRRRTLSSGQRHRSAAAAARGEGRLHRGRAAPRRLRRRRSRDRRSPGRHRSAT